MDVGDDAVEEGAVTLFTKEERDRLAGNIAKGIGNALGQEYRKHNGEWWLFTLGKPARALRSDELNWHMKRNHAPFIANGQVTSDALWFAEPEQIVRCRCGASLCCCEKCGAKWCLDHQPSPLTCPGCGERGTGK